MSDDRVSVRDKYERDEEGKLKGDKNDKKQKKDKKKWFRRKKDKEDSSGGGGGSNIILFLILIVVAIFLVKNVDMFNPRNWNSTIFENFALVENSLEKTSHKHQSGEYEDDFYDENRIYNDKLARDQIDKEYVVYVYTSKEDENEPYDEWVKENDDDVLIYKLHEGDIKRDKELIEYNEDGEPMFVLFNEVDRGEKEIDGVIKDPDLFDKIPDRINEIIQEKEDKKEEEKQERIDERKKERENE